jgi:uncharacterized protein (DUF2062 family)
MNTATMIHFRLAERCHHFWRERVTGVLVAQLKQGISPEKIALTIGIGFCLSIFPILGTTSLLCLLAGVTLKLNQPVIQLVNWLGSPLQLGLFPVFVRLGERMLRAPRVSFSIPELFTKFRQSPVTFFKEFGLTGWHGIVGWAAVIPFTLLLLYAILLPLTKKIAARL